MQITTDQFAEEILRTYETRIAQDWIDGLLFMSTAGSRIQVCHGIKERIRTALQVDDGRKPKYAGIHAEGVLGDFGSGKSHMAFLIRHDLVNMGSQCIILHCQMTAERRFSQVLAKLLRSARLSGVPSVLESGIELSAFLKLADALRLSITVNLPIAEQIVRSFSGGLPAAFARDFVAALAGGKHGASRATVLVEFIDRWIAKEPSRPALEAFEAILATFQAIEIAPRCLIVLDELEALESVPKDAQLEFVQSVQDLHDDFATRVRGLPSTFLLLFSAPQFWDIATGLLPSMFGESNRVRRITRLGPMCKSELFGLVDKYQTMSLLAGRTGRILEAEEVIAIVDAAWEQIVKSGRQHHMRTVHDTVRQMVMSKSTARPADAPTFKTNT